MRYRVTSQASEFQGDDVSSLRKLGFLLVEWDGQYGNTHKIAGSRETWVELKTTDELMEFIGEYGSVIVGDGVYDHTGACLGDGVPTIHLLNDYDSAISAPQVSRR